MPAPVPATATSLPAIAAWITAVVAPAPPALASVRVAPAAASAEVAPAAIAERLSEVMVTARRRQERLQDVPASVSVIDGRTLEGTRTFNTQNLALLVPSLYFNSANPRNTAYTLRGLGSSTLSISAANDGIEPGVGFYVDEVYHARPATAAFDFTDIERIEVLRGPQGTLFGKNTTGGAIHVISRPPSFEPQANGELAFGGQDLLQARASVSGPIGEQVAGRVSGLSTRRAGTLRNVRTGDDLNALDSFAVRGQVLFAPRPGLRLRLIGDVADLDSACCTQPYLRVGESRRSPARQFPALAAGLGYRPPSLDVYDRLTDVDAALRVDTQEGGVALLADWQRGAGTLTSVTAWRYWDWDVANDRDFTGLPIQSVQRIPSRQDQYSQELRFAGTPDGPWRYVAGLYAFSQSITGEPTSIFGPEAAYWLLDPANFRVPIPRNLLDGYGQTGRSRFRLDSQAAFGELDRDLSARVTATLGLRYTRERKVGRYATDVFGGPELTAFGPAAAAELRRAQASILRPQSYEARDRDGSLSGRANLAFELAAGRIAYVAYAHGYKSGGINMSGLPLDAANRPALATAVIGDEVHRAAELGFKATGFDGRASLNVAVYRTEVEDYQANVVSSVETAALRAYPANVPQVRVQGVEFDLAANPFPGLALRASLAFADGANTDYPEGPCPLELQSAGTTACDLTGAPLAGLSRWSSSLGAEYRAAAGAGQLVLRVDVASRSGYFGDASASRYTWIDGHDLANASIGYESAAGWAVEMFARNLLDERYLTALTFQSGNSGLVLGQPGDPRLVGVAIRAAY